MHTYVHALVLTETGRRVFPIGEIAAFSTLHKLPSKDRLTLSVDDALALIDKVDMDILPEEVRAEKPSLKGDKMTD